MGKRANFHDLSVRKQNVMYADYFRFRGAKRGPVFSTKIGRIIDLWVFFEFVSLILIWECMFDYIFMRRIRSRDYSVKNV